MLQIRLKRDPSADGGGAGKPVPAETVTVACPDHLVLADLPVAKGLGAASSAAVVKVVGRKSRRQLGERVHFCVRCDFPIAIYGRLSPCDHAFCLDCARSDSICYLCDERIQKIQTIKMMEGIFVCAAPHCLKSFMKKNEFESHIHESHSDLLHPNTEKEDGNESEVRSMKQFATVSESTARAPSRPGFSPGSVQIHDREDKARHGQPREQPPPRQMMQQKPLPYGGPIQNNPSESQIDNRSFNRFNQQGVDAPVSMQQEPCQFPEKPHGMPSESPFPEYPPMHQVPQPFMMPLPGNPMVNPPPPFGFPPFQGEGAQPFYGAPYEMVRQDSGPEAGLEQGSLLGFPPVPPGGMNFPANYPQHWNAGMAGTPFEPANTVQGSGDGYMNPPDYVRNAGVPPLNPPPMTGSSSMDLRDGKGILAPQPLPLPPPPPAPPSSHMPQLKRGKFYQGDMGRDGQGFGWQHENQD